MSHPATKPEAILQLEQELGFELTDLTYVSSDTNIDSWQSKTYTRNQEGEVIQLNLTGCKLEKIPNLLAFENLQDLDLSHNKISCIEGLDKLPELQSLDLSINQLSHIEGLEQLLNLQSLNLGFNQLFRIVGLEQLTKLQSLYLWYNQLSRIEGLEQLPNLQSLNLDNNQLTNIEGLEQLLNLQSLNLENNQLTNIEGLEQLLNLRSLNLGNNQLTSIVGLEQLLNLGSLNLRGNQLTSIVGLEQLPKLFLLNLNNNQLTSIEALGKLSDLYLLSLGNNQLMSIEGLDKLTELHSLDLSKNQLKSIKGLEHLPKLRSLDLSGNQLKSIEGLEHLSKLHSLNLSGNRLKSIESLEALEELDELDSSDNQLSHTKGLDSLSKLRRLNLSRNQLSKIEGLEPLSLLESLDLSNNRFSVIENLPQTSLKELKVEGNDIKYIRRDLSDKDSEQLPCRLIFTPYENHLEDIKRWEQRRPSETLDLPIKVMLLGNHSSGKSTFLNSLCKRKKKTGSTHVLRVVKRKDLGANFYDFGGQDFYHGIYQAFYSTGALYMLFWRKELDENRRGKEFVEGEDPHREKILNFNRNYWLGQIRYADRQRRLGKQDGSDGENILVVQTYADKDDQQNLKRTTFSVREEFYIALERGKLGMKARDSLLQKRDKVAQQYLHLRLEEEIAQLKEKMSIDVTESEGILYNYILNEEEREKSHSPTSIEDLRKAMPDYEDPTSSLKGELHQLYLHGEVLYYKENYPISYG